MKLQTKINYRFLLLLLVVFIMAGGVLYGVLGFVVNDNLDEILRHRKKDMHEILLQEPGIKSITDSLDKSMTIEPAKGEFKKRVSDTIIYDPNEKDFINFRKLTYVETTEGKYYKISLTTSKFEKEDMVEMIFYFMLGLFMLIVLLLFFLNRWISSSAWKPFYKTITQLEAFKIGQKDKIVFDNSDVSEFEQLNQSLEIMVQKAQSDFNNLKEFTENASHEIQTPMAVIKSKLESVLQDKTLPTKRYEQVQSAYETVSRLSKLNEALLLLSKIENQQFTDVAEIDLCEIIKQRLEFLEELIDFKKIKITLQLEHTVIVKLNPYLAEILINNLIGNAIKHNIEGGQIIITSTPHQLVFSNFGNPLIISPDKLFQRFSKYNSGNDSTGLGLSIASEICAKSNLKLEYNYNYENGFHNLVISYNL